MVFTSSLRSNSDRADFCNCWVLRDGGNRTKSAKITLPVHGRKHTTKRYWCEGRASSIAPLSYEEPIASVLNVSTMKSITESASSCLMLALMALVVGRDLRY